MMAKQSTQPEQLLTATMLPFITSRAYGQAIHAEQVAVMTEHGRTYMTFLMTEIVRKHFICTIHALPWA